MPQDETQIVDSAVAEAGAYDVIRKRLDEQEFGGVQMQAVGRTRIRTENNCVPRDIVQVGSTLLFGYNVFIGLKKETKIEDVFASLELIENDEGFELKPIELSSTFLSDSRFKGDFDELYRPKVANCWQAFKLASVQTTYVFSDGRSRLMVTILVISITVANAIFNYLISMTLSGLNALVTTSCMVNTRTSISLTKYS